MKEFTEKEHPAANAINLFLMLTQIPRPSGHEETVAGKIAEFARKNGLEASIDSANNVHIFKDAAPGYENVPSVCLQGHTDIVAVAREGLDFDFVNTPLPVKIENGFIFSDGTSLGADDGIGVAVALAAATDPNLVHGPLELLFTTGEETTMGGASALKPGCLKSKYLLNLDNETEGLAVIGCAGGINAEIRINIRRAPLGSSDGLSAIRLKISGFKGGHSGEDIDKKRINAIRCIARLVKSLSEKFDVRLSDLKGGKFKNAIPASAEAVLVIHGSDSGKVADFIRESERSIKDGSGEEDKNAIFEISSASADSYIENAGEFLANILAWPDGVLRMSTKYPGLPEDSSNLGVLRTGPSSAEGSILIRSNTHLDEAAAEMKEIFRKNGGTGEVVLSGAYYPWVPIESSPLTAAVQESFRKVAGRDMRAAVIHAGVECALLTRIVPDLDAVSFGPDALDIHSEHERISLETIDRFWLTLKDVLETFAKARK